MTVVCVQRALGQLRSGVATILAKQCLAIKKLGGIAAHLKELRTQPLNKRKA